mgnify:CR=1 FL=1
MVNDRENELKVKRYAVDNHYTILANTFGTLEYVKYCNGENRITKFLKWSKGSDLVTISISGNSKKIKINNLDWDKICQNSNQDYFTHKNHRL